MLLSVYDCDCLFVLFGCCGVLVSNWCWLLLHVNLSYADDEMRFDSVFTIESCF